MTTDYQMMKLRGMQREALREAMKPYYGDIVGTGGGCEAMRVTFDSGYQVLITDDDDATIDSFGPFTLGLYVDPEIHGSWDNVCEQSQCVDMFKLSDALLELDQAAKDRLRFAEAVVVIPGVTAAHINADGVVTNISFEPHGASAGYQGPLAEIITDVPKGVTLALGDTEGPFWRSVQQVLRRTDSKIDWME